MSGPDLEALVERCAEILSWHRTGLLTGEALRSYAASLPIAEEDDALRQAEQATLLAAAALIPALREALTDAQEAIDSAEIAGGLTTDGNLWRFWSRKTIETATKLTAALERTTALEADVARLTAERDRIERNRDMWRNEVKQQAAYLTELRAEIDALRAAGVRA